MKNEKHDISEMINNKFIIMADGRLVWLFIDWFGGWVIGVRFCEWRLCRVGIWV